MTWIRPVVSSLSFDLRAISELAQNTNNCLRSDLGEVNYSIPVELRDAMSHLSTSETFSYAPTLGDPALLKSIAGLEASSYSSFETPTALVTSGGQAALFAILASVLNQGDLILTDSAYYPPYKSICQLLNAQLMAINFDQLSSSELNGIKILLINAPQNPTGKCYTVQELEQLARLARKYDWLIIEDAVYNQIYFEDPPVSIAAFCPERTLIVNSVSKNFCLPGMRIGWIIGESNLVLEVAKMHRNMNSCPNTFFQRVLAGFIPRSAAFFHQLRQEMKARRGLMMAVFDELNWQYTVPDGAIYIFVTVPGLDDTYGFVKSMIVDCGVSAMPGVLFGNHPQAIRFCFGSLPQDQINLFGQRLIKMNK